jgi:hypothetical protein
MNHRERDDITYPLALKLAQVNLHSSTTNDTTSELKRTNNKEEVIERMHFVSFRF